MLPERLPLSFAQRRQWLLDKLEGPSTISFVTQLHGDVNAPALRAAIGDVIERHESLRTVFGEHEGELYQQVLPPADIPFTASQAGPESVREAVERPFDLARELPIRVELISDSRRDHVLVVVMHRIAADEHSVHPLFDDLATAYAARRVLRAPDFAPLPGRYAGYSQDQRAYWRAQLAGLPEELAIPTDRPRPARASRRGAVVNREIPADLHAEITGLARRTATTPFTVLQAAVAVLLSELGAGEDIPIGLPAGGRPDPALVGLFTNTVVLRTDLSGDPSVGQLLARVQDTARDAFAHAPFEDMSWPCQVMVDYRDRQVRMPELAGLRSEPLVPPVVSAEFDLGFTFECLPAESAVSVTYAADLFDATTVDLLIKRLLVVIEQVTGDSSRRLSELSAQSYAGRFARQ